MSSPERPVDRAMSQERPEKSLVRSFWIEEIVQASIQYDLEEEPLYLTLSGAEGRDISLLVDAGVLRLTEAGGIVTEDQSKIVAIEADSAAALSLQRSFPALKILDKQLSDLVRGSQIYNWPERKDRGYFRARVVNLDFDKPLAATSETEITFPAISWINKLAHLHAEESKSWCLLLTFHAELHWDSKVCQFVQSFLSENFRREAEFRDSCHNLLGRTLCSQICASDLFNFSNLSAEMQQKILMILVPKLITNLVHQQGWKIRTQRNLRYGGGNTAPMVTWVIQFEWNSAVQATPDSAYREALAGILADAGMIRENGKIEGASKVDG